MVAADAPTAFRWIVHLRRRVQSLEREVDTGKGEMTRIARVAAGAQKELDIAKTEMLKIAKVATAAQRELDIARGETRLLNKVINGLQQRSAVTNACRPAVAVRSGVMSGSVRSTTTAVLHRGQRYAPDALHQPRCQSQRLVDVMVDSGMRSPEETWSGISAGLRKTWRSSALPRRVVYDGRPLNAAAGAVIRRRTWKEYGVNI